MSEKNNAVLASGSLPSVPLPSPLTPTIIHEIFFFPPGVTILENAWRSDCAQRELCNLPSSRYSSLLLGSPQIPSTPPPSAAQTSALSLSTQPSQGSFVSVAEPNCWQSSPPEASHNMYAVLIVVCLWARIKRVPDPQPSPVYLRVNCTYAIYFSPDLHTSNKIPADLFPSQLP